MALLIPREHGAYGQLGFPMLTALAAGRPAAASILLVVAAAAAFVAHEPVFVLMGQRGPRAKRELALQAGRMLWGAGGVAIGAGMIGVWLMPPPLRWTVLVPAALALAVAPLIVWRAHKDVGGEVYLAATLSSVALPIGVASGLSSVNAALCAMVFALGFSAATLAVRGTIAVQRREPSIGLRFGAAALALADPCVIGAAALRMSAGPLSWTAALPLSLLAIGLALAPPPARHLYRIGWGLTAAAIATGVLLVVLMRGALGRVE